MHYSSTPSPTSALDALDMTTRRILLERHAACPMFGYHNHPSAEECARDIVRSRARAQARR